MHGSTGGGWKPGMVRRLRHCQTKGAAPAGPRLQPRRQSSTLPKVRTVEKWSFFALYVVLDMFSRMVVGWSLVLRENSAVARALIETCCREQGVTRDQLTLHADHGAAMTSKTLAELLIDLGVARSHSRPRVSDDNPYSEAHFKTVKYRPGFPDRFGPIQEAREYFRRLIHWYNHEHHHAAIGLLTPADVHYARTQEVIANRQSVLAAAYAAHPERFRRPPVPPALPAEVWINRPGTATLPLTPPTTS